MTLKNKQTCAAGSPRLKYRSNLDVDQARPLPNPALQRTCSSLTLGSRPLNGKVVRQTKSMREVGAFICGHVFDQSRPVLLASRADGDWQLLCGGSHEPGEGPHLVGLNHLLDRDPSLRELLDLPRDWEAERVTEGDPWERRPSPTR
jgi:hypothetical protein